MDSLLPYRTVDTVDIRNEIEILDSGHKLVDIRVIGNIGDVLFAGQRIFPHRDTIDLNISFLKRKDPADTFDRCGLAGAVMADKTADFSRSDLESKIIHCFDITIAFCKIPDI